MLKHARILVSFIVLITVSVDVCAQTARADSLKAELFKGAEDTLRVNTLVLLCWELRTITPESAIQFAERAFILATRLNFSAGQAKAMNNIGVVYHMQGEFDEALDYYSKARIIYERAGLKKPAASVLSNIGSVYQAQNNYPAALEYYSKSLVLARASGDRQRMAITIGSIGVIYYDQGEYAPALACYLESLRIREELNDKQGMAYAMNNIGILYDEQKNYTKALEYYSMALDIRTTLKDKQGISVTMINIGMVHFNRGDYNNALDYFTRSLSIAEECGFYKGISASLSNIGDVYREKQELQKASEYYEKALKITIETSDKRATASIYWSMGAIEKESKNYSKATSYFEKSLELSLETDDMALQKDNYLSLSSTWATVGNYSKAYESAIKYAAVKDSIYTDEGRKEMADIETKYETEKKEKEISLLKKESEVQTLKLRNGLLLIFLISGFLLLFAASSIIIFKAYRTTKKVKRALEITNKEISLQKEQITLSKAELQVEKQKSDNLLLNILPVETAEELKAEGHASVKDYRNVTVMFTDFAGFTKITEQLTPEELIGELNKFFIRFDEITLKYGIEKIKTIGDSYMCAAGLPIADANAPKNVLSAALEILQFVDKCNEEKRLGNLPVWEIRIGVHTGNVIAGVVGKRKFAYDIWGDTVNCASRLESAGETGKINISGSTFNFIKDFFICTHRGKISIKHMGDIDMYFVNGLVSSK